MSPRRRITALSATAAALALLYAMGLLVNRQPAPAVVVPGFRVSSAERIVAGSVELRKSGTGWQLAIGGAWYPADGARVDRLLGVLSGLTADRVASRARSDWPTFQVDSAQASRLEVTAGGRTLADLYVGQVGSSGVFVRVKGRSAVYEVSARLANYVSGGAATWSYLRILPQSLSIGSLQTIGISARGFSVGGSTVTASYLLISSVVAGKSAWVVRGDRAFKLDQQKVLDLEAEIVDMLGDSFAAGTSLAAAGLEKPTATITIANQQGGKWTLEVGSRYGAQFYLKRADEPYIYLVNQWTLQRAIPALGSLAAK